MKASAGSLLRNTSGNATILFALAAVPLMIAAGVAIDRIRLDHARTEMQAALDGAALAAAMAEDRTDAQRERLARNYFKQNFSYAQANDVDFTIEVTASRVVAQSRIAHPTSFMRLAGIESTDLAVASEVMRPKSGKAEVVLVLDYSGSMSANKKSVRMAAAAAEMVRTLDEAMPDDKLKFGLVPFSAMVHTTMPADYVTQAAAGASWTGCTQDRVHPYNLTVDTPTGDAASKWGYIDKSGENNGAYGCAAYSARSLGILPLTTDMAAVKTKLGAMQPLGNTNIPLGAEFGWNLLDPTAPYEEGAPYSDKIGRATGRERV